MTHPAVECDQDFAFPYAAAHSEIVMLSENSLGQAFDRTGIAREEATCSPTSSPRRKLPWSWNDSHHIEVKLTIQALVELTLSCWIASSEHEKCNTPVGVRIQGRFAASVCMIPHTVTHIRQTCSSSGLPVRAGFQLRGFHPDCQSGDFCP